MSSYAIFYRGAHVRGGGGGGGGGWCPTLQNMFAIEANIMNSDQTAPKGAV